MNSIPIALPPEGEQRRIVAKVDALMAPVDRQEAQLTKSRSVATDLMEAAVAELSGVDRAVGQSDGEKNAE
jgi:restriction endonuclease S subunit